MVVGSIALALEDVGSGKPNNSRAGKGRNTTVALRWLKG